MKGEDSNLIRARELLRTYDTLDDIINKMLNDFSIDELSTIENELLSIQQKVLEEYNELYVLLKIKYDIEQKDFSKLELKQINKKSDRS